MKKLLAATIITTASIVAVVGRPSVAGAQQPQPDTQFKMSQMTSTLDGIDIPHAVLDYVQLTYEGHAVTKAERTVMNGREAYRLRVDRDDVANDYVSFTLLFDNKWQLFGKEDLVAPPPKLQQKPVKPQQEEKEKPKPEPKEEKEEERESGGSGAGAIEEEPAIKPDEEDGAAAEPESGSEAAGAES